MTYDELLVQSLVLVEEMRQELEERMIGKLRDTWADRYGPRRVAQMYPFLDTCAKLCAEEAKMYILEDVMSAARGGIE